MAAKLLIARDEKEAQAVCSFVEGHSENIDRPGFQRLQLRVVRMPTGEVCVEPTRTICLEQADFLLTRVKATYGMISFHCRAGGVAGGAFQGRG